MLITIPKHIGIKPGDNVQIVKTDKTVSTRNEIISEIILKFLTIRPDKFTIYNKFKTIATNRKIDSILFQLIKDKKIEKVFLDDEYYYQLLL